MKDTDDLEMLNEIEPGWFRQKWEPICGQTWCIWKPYATITGYGSWSFGLGFRASYWRNGGWGRSNKTLVVQVHFGPTYEFWIKWDFSRMKDLQ